MHERMKRARAEEQGFTLIELLIVVVILGILAAVVVFAVGNTRDTAVESACKSDTRAVIVAVEAYRAQNGEWPASMSDITPVFLREDPNDPDKEYSIALGAEGAVTATPDCDSFD